MERKREERRCCPRFLCSHLVEITCPSGRQAAVLEDISREGAAVVVEAPAAARILGFFGPGFQALAQVRYCLRRETDFRVGLRFEDGRRWQPGLWKPDHLWMPPD